MNQLHGPLSKPNLTAAGNTADELGPATAAAQSSEQAFFTLDVTRSLQLHWKLAAKVAIGFAALALVYLMAQVFWYKSWPTFLAVSTVYIQPTPAKVLPSEGGAPRWPFDSNTYETYIQQQMMNVSRDDVLIDAVHKLNGFQGAGESDQAAAQRLVRTLEVNRIGEAYQFTISARAGTAQAAADIANAVTAAYIGSASRDERTGDTQRLAMLKDEKDRIVNELAADRAEQDTLNRQLGVASVAPTVPDHYDDDITQIRTELAKARTDHDIAEQKFASLGAGHGPSSSVIDAQADEMIATDPGLVSMKASLSSRRAALVSQMVNMTPANPQYKQDEAELENIDKTLEGMAKDLRAKAAARIQLQLRADLQRTGGVESELNGQLRQLVGSATSATPKLQRSSDLAADIARLQARYAAVDEQVHNVLLEDTAPAAAYQVLPATPPLTRTKSGVLRNAVLILFAGFFFAILAAIAAHRLDPRIYIAADVERVLGFAPLALLPDLKDVSESVYDEYMLRLASAIEHGRKQGNLKNIIFTGTGSGTGVTSVVNRVRTMLQAMGRLTVLVDATGAQAPVTRAPGARAPQSGIVPVQRVSRPTALLQKMEEGTEAEQESLVLTDTAPLLVSAETEYLARYVDCAIVVVESGLTTRHQLRDTATMLQRLGVGAVGFVLNRIGLEKAEPAFRASVEAAKKHLEALTGQAVRNAEISPSAVTALSTETSHPIAYSRRSMFEPEVAAAAAAVARFTPADRSSLVADSEPAVCLASPTLPTPAPPIAEAAKRFSVPLIAEAAAEPAKAVRNVKDTVRAIDPISMDPVLMASPQQQAKAAAPVEPTAPAAPALAPAAPSPHRPSLAAQPTSPLAEAAQSAASGAAAGFTDPDARPFDISEFTRPSVPVSVAAPVPASIQDTSAKTPVAPTSAPREPSAPPLAPEPVSEPAAAPAPESASPLVAVPLVEPPVAPEPVAAPVAAPVAKPAVAPVSAPVAAPAPAAASESPLAPSQPQQEHLAATPPAEQPSPVPWWLSEAPHIAVPEPVRPPVLWQPAKTRGSQGHAAEAELRIPAKPGNTLSGSVPNSPNRPQGSRETGFAEAIPSDLEGASSVRTSRLSGLRNLLFVLGGKNNSNPDAPDASQHTGPSGSQNSGERTVIEAQQNAERTPGLSPRPADVAPESLSSKGPVADQPDSEAEQSSTRQDRRPTPDGIQVLPSQHGQYNKL